MKKIRSPDEFFANTEQWKNELLKLRSILLTTKLAEEIKWGAPCYTFNGKNIVGLAGYNSYFGLWFHQGALLADPNKVLINAQEGKTKALRQWRVTSEKEIKPAIIKRYVNEAIALAKADTHIASSRGNPVVIPPELKMALSGSKKTLDAFSAVSPGLQREYANYIAEAKRAETKARRIEKILPMINAGKSLNEKYR